jgi:hypothetical protein
MGNIRMKVVDLDKIERIATNVPNSTINNNYITEVTDEGNNEEDINVLKIQVAELNTKVAMLTFYLDEAIQALNAITDSLSYTD